MIGAVAGALGALALASLAHTLAFTRRVERLFPPVGHRVDLGRGRLHVVETAPTAPERGVALLIHGASGNFADPQVALGARLAARGFRVFSVDRPGHGWSDRLDGAAAAAPRRQALRIREALAKLGVRECVVVVHSLAGVLGLAMALQSPRFVRGLVLIAPVSHPWRGGVSWYYSAAAAAGLGALFCWLIAPLAGLASLNGALKEVFAPNPIPPDYARRTRLKLLFRPKQFRANARDFVALCEEARALSQSYREIAVPVAVVMGNEDRLVSADIHARALGREIPGATLALLPGVGHSPHFCAPDAVVGAIVDVDDRAARARDGAAKLEGLPAANGAASIGFKRQRELTWTSPRPSGRSWRGSGLERSPGGGSPPRPERRRSGRARTFQPPVLKAPFPA